LGQRRNEYDTRGQTAIGRLPQVLEVGHHAAPPCVVEVAAGGPVHQLAQHPRQAAGEPSTATTWSSIETVGLT